MRFSLTLIPEKNGSSIPVNYQYPLSASIYRILERADSGYSSFLHDKGYGKGFKLFTFSDLKCNFRIEGDRFRILDNEVRLLIAFQLPQAMDVFIKGLFQSQLMTIADRKSRSDFVVKSVETLADPLGEYNDLEIIKSIVRPISPIVCGWKNERGNYDFLSPQDANFCEVLTLNWREKLRTIFGESETENGVLMIDTRFFRNAPKSRLITIKAGSHEETKIRGWMNFELIVTGEKRFLEVILNSGMGVYNAQGMGCVERV